MRMDIASHPALKFDLSVLAPLPRPSKEFLAAPRRRGTRTRSSRGAHAVASLFPAPRRGRWPTAVGRREPRQQKQKTKKNQKPYALGLAAGNCTGNTHESNNGTSGTRASGADKDVESALDTAVLKVVGCDGRFGSATHRASYAF